MPNWPSTWREERDISKDNDAVAIRREAAVHLRRGVSQPGAWYAVSNCNLELVVKMFKTISSNSPKRSNWPSAWVVEEQDITNKLHLDAWHVLEHVHLDLVVEKANLQIQRAIDLVDKDNKDNDAVAIRKEAAVAVVGLLDVFHLGAWHAVELELAVD